MSSSKGGESSQCDATSYFEIQPHKNASISPEDNYPWVHPPVPKPVGSRLILVGSSQCGKTEVFANLIDRYWIDPNTGKSVFDIVIIMSPTIEQDHLYEELYTNPILHDIIVPKREVDVELLKKITDRKPDNLKICVFIDDFAFNQKVFLLPEVKALYFRGRHANITPIISSQFFFAIDPSIRVNATGFMIFRLTRASEISLLRMQLSTPRIRDEKFDDVLREAHRESKYDFLFFDVPRQRYYQSFKYELSPPEQEVTDTTPTAPATSTLTAQKDEIDQAIEEAVKTFGVKDKNGQNE